MHVGGRSFLITGGTGTFGRAMARRLLADGADRVAIFSRGELSQAAMARDFGHDDRLRFFIGDVRDLSRLARACRGIDVVFHAAALKRVEVGHYNPGEMVKTNVLGAMNVVEAAILAGVERVVGISSDKAWQPCGVYGTTKALAETVFLHADETRGRHDPTFAVARYGNIWRSNGSVVPLWESLAPGPVPLTDPRCTRFFMRIEEAIEFVLRLAREMRGGELWTPDLPAFRLGDLVQAMGLETRIVGLRPYEKLHEGMRDGVTSDVARRMTIEELRDALKS